MSPAFIPGVAAGAFTAATQTPATCGRRAAAPRMAFNEVGPATSKYLSQIPIDRLNKAPMITINRIPGATDEYNSVSVALVDMARDEAAGNALKAGICIDDALVNDAPPQSKYAKYYPQPTLHEAPFISFSDGGTERTRSMAIIQTSVKTSMVDAKAVLGDGVPPSPMLYRAFDNGKLNQAPCCEANRGPSDEQSVVAAPYTTIPLDYVGASLIFKKYRK
jgi:hypothetical protein